LNCTTALNKRKADGRAGFGDGICAGCENFNCSNAAVIGDNAVYKVAVECADFKLCACEGIALFANFFYDECRSAVIYKTLGKGLPCDNFNRAAWLGDNKSDRKSVV
jgi:hypothetical protein